MRTENRWMARDGGTTGPRTSWLVAGAALLLLACGSSPGAAATQPAANTAQKTGGSGSIDFTGFGLLAMIVVPPDPTANPAGTLRFFDISTVDPATQRYFLADRSNAGVDEFDADHNLFLQRIGGFVGQKFLDAAQTQPDNDHSGPDGVLVIHEKHQLWAGDGDSTVKVIDLKTHTIVDTISTGGTARADEMSYDPRDEILIVANNADVPPFMTLISAKPGHAVLGRLTFADATDGLEQSVWDPKSGLFYLSVPALNGQGAVAAIDPNSMTTTQIYPVGACSPAGLALGPNQQLMLGCSATTSQSAVLDVTTGNVTTIDGVGGSDEVWFNPSDQHYYLAARNNPQPDGPALGVIDAATNTFTLNVPTATGAHSVAADSKNDHVFVPLPANPTNPASTPCVSGCIGVYGRPPVAEDDDSDDQHT